MTHFWHTLASGRDQFAQIGIDPYANLTAEDLGILQLNIEKRHVIGHNLGGVDENYAKNRANEEPGKTVQLLTADITTFAAISGQVIATLVAQCQELR